MRPIVLKWLNAMYSYTVNGKHGFRVIKQEVNFGIFELLLPGNRGYVFEQPLAVRPVRTVAAPPGGNLLNLLQCGVDDISHEGGVFSENIEGSLVRRQLVTAMVGRFTS